MREEYGAAGEQGGGHGGEQDVGAAAGDLEKGTGLFCKANYYFWEIYSSAEKPEIRK